MGGVISSGRDISGRVVSSGLSSRILRKAAVRSNILARVRSDGGREGEVEHETGDDRTQTVSSRSTTASL